VLPVLVALGFLATWLPLEQWTHSFPRLSKSAATQGIGVGDRSWIDHAVGHNAHVAVLWSGGNTYAVWQNEFWNRSVDRVYDLGSPMGGGMPSTRVSLPPSERGSGILRDAAGRAIETPYMLTSTGVGLVGRIVASDPAKKLVLYRVSDPVRIATRITGLYTERDNPWSNGHPTWTRLDCTGGTLVVVVSSDSTLFAGTTQTLSIHGTTAPETLRLSPVTSQRRITLPLTPHAGICRVSFTISPTRRPIDVPAEHSNDPRRLGLHFNSVSYLPPR